ncbi:MAG: DegV family EDD domain-containing protein [Candidatus Heimdallarchaeota archaeon]|nr:DegV family EDD domain-containing protein [Candidatus Heimdallarchaeota archaeon]
MESQTLKIIKYDIVCPLCKKEILFEINETELFNNIQGDLAAFTIESHGNPPHTVTVYVDKNKEIKGTYPFLVKSLEKRIEGELQYNHIIDASADITLEEAIHCGLEIVPYDIIIDGKVRRKYLNEVSPAEVLKMITKNMTIESKSIQTDDFLKTFRFYDNKKEIIVNTTCSQLSKNYKNALKAKKTLQKEKPNLAEKINIIDTHAVGNILKLIAKTSLELDRKGNDLKEILRYIDWMKHSHRTYFMVDNLDSLKRSDILGTFTGFFSSVRGTKPLITCNVDGIGKIEPYKSVKDSKEGMSEFARLIKKDFRGRELSGIIFHSLAEEKALRLQEYLEIIMNIDKDDFSIEPVGSSVCIHGGIGLLGMSVYPKI